MWEIHWQSLPFCRVLLLLSLSQWLIHFWKLHRLCRQDFRSEKLNPVTNTTLYFLPESYASFLSKTRSFKLNTKKLFLWHCSLQKSILVSICLLSWIVFLCFALNESLKIYFWKAKTNTFSGVANCPQRIDGSQKILNWFFFLFPKDFLRKVFCPVIRETFPNSNLIILVPAWYHMSRKYFIHRPEHLLYMRLKWSATRNGKWWSVVVKCWKKLPLLMIQAARWKKKRYIWQNETLCLEFSYNLKFARDRFTANK